MKKYVLLLLMLWILGGGFLNLAMLGYDGLIREEQYRVYAGLIGEIRQCYPQVREEALIRCLTQTDGSAAGEALFRKYGILEKGELYSGQNRERLRYFLYGNGALLIMAGMSLAVLDRFWRGRKRKLRELERYIDSVSHGRYDLELQKNREDEFSGLQNDLYKLTVLYREQAERASEGKRTLADSVADISHQLKTPLTSAVIMTDNLLEAPDMEPEVRVRFLQEISRQLVGMKWLVVTMLKLSRLDAGVVELKKERVSFQRVAEEAIQKLEMMAQWKEIRFKTSLSDTVINGDEKWFSEALQNIVKNAIEHSPQGGAIEIETQENEVYAQISVRDHGEGIPELEQKHLFERFYRSSKAEDGNVGIGLALAREIIQKMNGTILVDSGREGMCFVIRMMKSPAWSEN